MRYWLPTHGAFSPWRNKNKWSPDAPHFHPGRDWSISLGWITRVRFGGPSRGNENGFVGPSELFHRLVPMKRLHGNAIGGQRRRAVSSARYILPRCLPH